TATFRAYCRAVKNKNLQAVKSYLSGHTLQVVEKEARIMRKSLVEVLDDALAEFDCLSIRYGEEQLSGDTALVDMDITVNNETSTFRAELGKEAGRWKVSIERPFKLLSEGQSASADN